MTGRTLLPADFDEYLRTEHNSEEARTADIQERSEYLLNFPFPVMLQVAIPELDFANRWCWENFGPAHGECLQSQSEYPVCKLIQPHSHIGVWMAHWYMKIAYDFGYNEWYFANESDRNRFCDNVPNFNWGELYPK